MRSESNTSQQCRPQTTATTCSCDLLIQVQHSNLAAKKVSPWILQRALPSFRKLSGLKSKPTRWKSNLFEFVLTTYISVCTQPQHVLAILSLSPEFRGLHFVGYSALLKDRSLNPCVTGKYALTFRDRCSTTKASDIVEAH